jgi:glycerophosphoryl diester phosphodiesterase
VAGKTHLPPISRTEPMATRPLLLGHRGVRAEKSIPENSLASFDLALTQGCAGFEFDVRLTADRSAVICHDATSGVREIAACFAEQLNLPSLREVLSRYHRTAFLDIELKVAGLETIVVDSLHALRPARGFVVSSFLPAVLKTVRNLDSHMPLGLICETRAQLSRWTELPVEYVIPQYQLLGPKLFGQLKGAGKKIFVWTVNAPADAQRFSEWGVEGIISDNPKQLLSSLTGDKDK